MLCRHLVRSGLAAAAAGVSSLPGAGAVAARSMSGSTRGPLFLGLDSSTQGLKASVVDESLQVVHTAAINYEKDLPHYQTKNGVLIHPHNVVTTPTVMLAEALDKLMSQLNLSQFDLGQITAVSGSGQQHGSAYWAQGARAKLQALDHTSSLKEQVPPMLSRQESPIWMDSSTSQQCRQLEEAVGGAQALADLTGSRGYERFTANQILKIVQQEPEVYANTEQVSLISSFLCSLLLGDYAAADTSDGAGMNLMDLRMQCWSREIMDAIAPDLHEKLLSVVPAHTIQGTISPYFVKRFGFDEACKVVTFSGDNPNSVAGLGLHQPGDVGLSMGTSDTIFSIIDAASSKPGLEGHIFVNPVDPNSHMAMLCYKNGSLARQNVAKRVAGGSWKTFDRMLRDTLPGNDGYMGFYIESAEIIPFIPKTGVRRFDRQDKTVARGFPEPAQEARAVVEGQMLSMRVHAKKLGITPHRIIVTGGASENQAICQVMSDVFGVSVQAADQPDSASLGAALRALHAWKCKDGEFVAFHELVANGPSAHYHIVAEPTEENYRMYTELQSRYQRLEDQVVASCEGFQA